MKMKDRAEFVHTNTANNEQMSIWSKLTAIGALSSIALTGCAAQAPVEDEPAQQTQTTEAPAPETTVTQAPEKSREELIAEIEIPAGLEQEAYAETLASRLTDWANAGAIDSLLDRSMELNLSWQEMYPLVADEQAEVYAAALLGDGWQADEDASAFVERMKQINMAVLDRYVITAWSSDERPENVEPYRSYFEVFDTASLSGGPEGGWRKLQIIADRKNNGDMNSLGKIESTHNGRYTIDVLTQPIDGVEKPTQFSMWERPLPQ